MTPSGIEQATFRFVAQRLNHCATAVPKVTIVPNQLRIGGMYIVNGEINGSASHSNFDWGRPLGGPSYENKGNIKNIYILGN